MLCSSPISAKICRNTDTLEPGPGGDVQAALGHEGQQANGLEHNGFAPRVGAGDQQQIEVVPQARVDRHHFIGQFGNRAAFLLAGPLQEQRMTGLTQMQRRIRSHLGGPSCHSRC